MQMEQLQTEKQNLQRMAMQTSDTLSAVAAKKGGGPQASAPPEKMGVGSMESPNAIVDNARNMMGVPTGTALPT